MLAVIFVLAAVAAYAIISYEVPRHRAAQSECNPAELAAASAKGDEEAAKVALTPPRSMARQSAIMAIRAHETEIRRAGFPTAADSFAAAAERRLISDRVI